MALFLLLQPYFFVTFFNGECGILLQVNMGFLKDIHLLLGLVVMLPLMEAMESLLKFIRGEMHSFVIS